MEAKSAKVQIMIEPSLVARIDDWRFENRVGSRSEAMRNLISRAMDAENEKGPAATAIAPDHEPTNP
ncbi:hypothetical protein [Devosia sp. XK-2]|uniref:hypothetical protein n=1 Tax=Devosia sp. XK-2 TaxID=3126689 RepID=UPI0030CB60AE